MAQPNADDNVDNVFLEARNAFLASLSKHEQSLVSECSSAEELLSEVAKLADFRSKHPTVAKPLDKIKKFSDQLECYFKAVDIFVQINPEHSAIAWGAIRLVLQV